MMRQQLIQKNTTMTPAFIPFITGGFPTYESSIEIAVTLQSAGATVLEVGIPYSDPLADGPTIQASSQMAIERGMTFSKSFELIADMRKVGVTIPIIIFCYYNPVYQLGFETFVQKALQSGANGVLVPDLPYEEGEALRGVCQQHSFPLISLVAPTSQKRVQQIVSNAEGFVYCISSLGVTGMRDGFDEQLETLLSNIKSSTSLPVAVGFGVSKREQVQFLAEKVDGVIVGSAIVKHIADNIEAFYHEQSKTEALKGLKRFVKELMAI